MAQQDRLDSIIPEWSERVSDHIAAFHARNSLRNDPLYVLEVEGRIALREESESGQLANENPNPAPANGSVGPRRTWFNRKQQ